MLQGQTGQTSSMTRDDVLAIQSIAFRLADGGAVLYPPAAPIVAAVEKLVLAAEAAGIKPVRVSAEQLASILAGETAAQASAVTAYKEHHKHDSKPLGTLARTPTETDLQPEGARAPRP